MSSPNVSDPYMPSYYPSMSGGYFVNQGGLANDGGAWSSGDPMSFLGYGQMAGSDGGYMSSNGMFNAFSYSQQPGFEWGFNAAADYSTWGPSTASQQQQGRKTETRYEDYYRMDNTAPMDAYGNMNGELERDNNVKSVEQGLSGMNLNDPKVEASVQDNIQPVSNEGLSPSPSAGPSNSGGVGGVSVSQAPKKMTWASIASQPARPQPQLKPKTIPRAPVLPGKHNMDIGTWDSKNTASKQQVAQQPRQAWSAPRGRSVQQPYSSGPSNSNSPASGGSGLSNSSAISKAPEPSHPVLDKLRSANQYNPKEFNINVKGARYFIIKSYSEDDIHRSIKYSIWCSTEHGNKRLDYAYREREGKGPIYFLFSVNGSGHFCGMAQMMSPVDYHATAGVWMQDKYKGQIEVKWIYVKDVPNSQLRHIRLENNENKPVTNSRDTQEVPPEKGKQVLKIIHNYRHTTSIFDDFGHYEKRQEEDTVVQHQKPPVSISSHPPATAMYTS